MKKIIIAFFFGGLSFYSNAQGTWNVGLLWAGPDNESTFKSGDADASALFTHHKYHEGQLGLTMRYTICKHWAFSSGIDFSNLGFTYSLANDYNLKKNDHYQWLTSATTLGRIPTLCIYQSKQNCSGFRWIFGMGMALNSIDANWDEAKTAKLNSEAGNVRITSFTSDSKATGATSFGTCWILGIEKVYKMGNMLSLVLEANNGHGELARSTVNYTIDNTNYAHTFSNKGTFGTLALMYSFKSMKER